MKAREIGKHEQEAIIEIVNKYHALYKNYTAQSAHLACSMNDGQVAQF